MSHITRVVLNEEPFPTNPESSTWNGGRLDAKFVNHPKSKSRPFFAVYSLALNLDKPLKARIHVTADERYQLFVNGQLGGRGSERGDEEHWFYESYDLDLPIGEHRISAWVWSLGDVHAPYAQVMVKHGFLCVADDPSLKTVLTTGHAAWKSCEMEGIEMIPHTTTYSVGDRFRFHGNKFKYDTIVGYAKWIDCAKGEDPTLPGANDLNPIRLLRHATLPAMMTRNWQSFSVRHVEDCAAYDTASVTIEPKNNLADQHETWRTFMLGNSLTIPPHTRRRAIIDLNNYACSYWHLTTSGGKGSKVRINFQEALIKDFKDGGRGNRDEVNGGHFVMMWSRALGFGDEVLPGGGKIENYTCPWWLAGRYMEIYVETGDEELILGGFRLEETHYPIEPQTSPFHCSDESLNKIVNICVRTLQMDAHETFYDCPYFEQLQYVGDTRIESIVMMAMTDDNRLCAKATDLYRWSIGYRGMTQSRYPCRTRQYIPPFSIWWVLMVHDQHLWRGGKAFLRQLLPAVRTVLSFFEQFIDRDEHSPGFGLLKSPDQWNFVDWVSVWPDGVPPGGKNGHSIVINMQLLLALVLAWVQQLRKAIKRNFNQEGLLLDAPGVKTVAEQQHALALLTNDRELQLAGQKWYSEARDATKATYYFQHYRHEALAKLGRPDLILANIRDQWGDMIKNGLKTTVEMPEPGRSDCHAWSAHPVLHLQTKILGLTPLAPYQFEFKPHLVDLDWAEGYVSTGRGPIHVRVEKNAKSWKASLVVPDGVTVTVPEVRGLIVGPKNVSIEP
jgi:alpha-L-rhamnosidase